MTGDEIIALARAAFGESTALTVTTQTATDFLNAALRELYNDLPPERMKNLIAETAVVMAGSSGPIEHTWDKVLEVYVDGAPATQVSKEVIQHASLNTLFAPYVPIVHIDTEYVWVMPTGSTIKVVHLDPPDEITATASEVTAFDEVWHSALAYLIASYMYAQEEDQIQAEYYRNEYTQAIVSITGQLQAEAAS